MDFIELLSLISQFLKGRQKSTVGFEPKISYCQVLCNVFLFQGCNLGVCSSLAKKFTSSTFNWNNVSGIFFTCFEFLISGENENFTLERLWWWWIAKKTKKIFFFCKFMPSIHFELPFAFQPIICPFLIIKLFFICNIVETIRYWLSLKFQSRY